MRLVNRLAPLASLIVTAHCLGQNYCDSLQRTGAVGLLPLSDSADKILKEISGVAGIDPATINLQPLRDPVLKREGAAAQVCNGNQRWIFYDPDFIDSIRTRTGDDWPKYFAFAHEVAHHVNNDTLEHHHNEELNADSAATKWLVRRGATMPDIVSSVNAFVVNEKPQNGYPSRCERIEATINSYDEVAREYNANGSKKPLYKYSSCGAVEVASSLPPRVVNQAPAVAPGHSTNSCAVFGDVHTPTRDPKVYTPPPEQMGGTLWVFDGRSGKTCVLFNTDQQVKFSDGFYGNRGRWLPMGRLYVQIETDQFTFMGTLATTPTEMRVAYSEHASGMGNARAPIQYVTFIRVQ